jgi:arabinose-5-phosphate isomerase
MKQKHWAEEMVRVLRLEGEAILTCAKRIEKDSHSVLQALDYFSRTLDAGGKIVITGVGKSGKVGQKIAATLSSTGSLSIFLHPTEGLHGDLGVIRSEDCLLALSHTGNTEEVLKLIPAIHKKKVPIVGMGGNPDSQLARQSHVWMDAKVASEACPHNLAPTTSTTLALALGDAIAMALMQMRGFDASGFAQNHPGGVLGKRLHLQVSDLMHASFGQVSPEANMEEVVMESTKKSMGAIFVMKKKELLGIITDGDLRRFLKYRERFFDLKAHEVMSVHPVTVTPETMAWEALQLMEKRESQISVLPVVDASGFCQGLLRLHDLLQSL